VIYGKVLGLQFQPYKISQVKWYGVLTLNVNKVLISNGLGNQDNLPQQEMQQTVC
jgi:hypothetical protein